MYIYGSSRSKFRMIGFYPCAGCRVHVYVLTHVALTAQEPFWIGSQSFQFDSGRLESKCTDVWRILILLVGSQPPLKFVYLLVVLDQLPSSQQKELQA